jgi:alpha-D-xyloside xylohydrolase
VDDRPDYDFCDGVTFVVGQFEEGASCDLTMVDLKGQKKANVTVRRASNILELSIHGEVPRYRILLAGERQASGVQGASASQVAQGTLLVPEAGVQQFSIRLD